MEAVLERSSFYWSPHSTYSVKPIYCSLSLNSFWYDWYGFEMFVVGGGFEVGRGFVSFLMVNSAKVPRQLLFNVSTLW